MNLPDELDCSLLIIGGLCSVVAVILRCRNFSVDYLARDVNAEVTREIIEG